MIKEQTPFFRGPITQELFDSRVRASLEQRRAGRPRITRTLTTKAAINLNKAALGRNDEYLLTNSLLRNNALVMTLGSKGRPTKGLIQHRPAGTCNHKRQDHPEQQSGFYDQLPDGVPRDISARPRPDEIRQCRNSLTTDHEHTPGCMVTPHRSGFWQDCYAQIKRTNADQEASSWNTYGLHERGPQVRTSNKRSIAQTGPNHRPRERTPLPPGTRSVWTLAASHIIKKATGSEEVS